MKFQGKNLPRSRISVPIQRKNVLHRKEWRPPAGVEKPISVKMVGRPQLAPVCGHYDYYYAQLDLLREKAHEPSDRCVPHKDIRAGNHIQEMHLCPSPCQWPAEYLQRKFEAQQYKLKVEKQLGLRPSSTELHQHQQRQELRRNGEEPSFHDLQLKRNEMKKQEYWKQLEKIRQQYHNDMKEIRNRIGSELEEDLQINHQTYLVRKSNLPVKQESPEEEAPVQTKDLLNETMTFEDGKKFKEYRYIKEHEDNMDKAFEKLSCPEAELPLDQDGTDAANRRQWDAGAPQTLLQMMAEADISSTCSMGPEVRVIGGVPENRKQWCHKVPGTLMGVLAAARLTNNSFSASEEFVGTLKQQPPKEDEKKVEVLSDLEVDEEQLESRSDDDDTNFEESEDELRNEVIESLEKLATSKEQENKEVTGSSEGAGKLGEQEGISTQKYAGLNEGLTSISAPSNEKRYTVEDQETPTTSEIVQV